MEIIKIEVEKGYEIDTESWAFDGIWSSDYIDYPTINNPDLLEVWNEYIQPDIDEYGYFNAGSELYIEDEDGSFIEAGVTNLTNFFQLLFDIDNRLIIEIEKFIEFFEPLPYPEPQGVLASDYLIIDVKKTSENIKEDFQLDPEWIKKKFMHLSEKKEISDI